MLTSLHQNKPNYLWLFAKDVSIAICTDFRWWVRDNYN